MKTSAAKNETRKNGMKGLPDDIICNIFLRLPIKSLIRCKDVCMAWCNIVENPRFIEDHFTQSTQNQPFDNILLFNLRLFPEEIKSKSWSLDFNYNMSSGASVVLTCIDMDFLHDPSSFYEGLRVSNPCNGLLCFTDLRSSGYASMYNPATRGYLMLPKEKHRNPIQFLPFVISAGLGFDDTSGVYKIVQLITTNDNWYKTRSYHVRMLTIGKDSWRSLGWFTYPVHRLLNDPCPITFAGGALHWLSESEDGNEQLISLNVGNEVFYLTQLPNFEKAKGYICLREWMGCVSLWRVGDVQTHIWVLKEYKIINKPWSKQCTMENEYEIGRYLVPLVC